MGHIWSKAFPNCNWFNFPTLFLHSLDCIWHMLLLCFFSVSLNSWKKKNQFSMIMGHSRRSNPPHVLPKTFNTVWQELPFLQAWSERHPSPPQRRASAWLPVWSRPSCYGWCVWPKPPGSPASGSMVARRRSTSGGRCGRWAPQWSPVGRAGTGRPLKADLGSCWSHNNWFSF